MLYPLSGFYKGEKTMEFALVGLLRAAWVAAVLPLLVASLPFSKLGAFRGLVLGFARRGKILHDPNQYKFTVPQKYFSHFYVLAVLWTAFLLLVTCIYAYNTDSLVFDSDPLSYSGSSSYKEAQTSVFLLLLMEIQVTRRLWETIYVFNYSPAARMHIFGYLTGLFYYTAAPLSLCCNCAPEAFKFVADGAIEFIFEGKSAVSAAGFDLRDFVDSLVKIKWCQWVGLIIVFWGWIHQYRCHAILGSLREHKEKLHSYAIPRGDWFELVSSPHYLAEIIVYAGLVVASGGADLTVWLLFSFVVANLAAAAGETHRWYLIKFNEYPRSRSAIIPLVY